MTSPFTSLIFLAGGIGSRMGSAVPKQFLPLFGKPIALHSFELFSRSSEIDEIIVVCDPSRRSLFECEKPVRFAFPGNRRQDSVYSGLLLTSPQSRYVLTHDAARPFLDSAGLRSVLAAVQRTGAAALAAPVSSTIKEAYPTHLVKRTLDRSTLWEMQTPQALLRSLFFSAFEHALRNNLDLTDDLSLAESVGHPAEIVPYTPRNFKITTPFDLAVAETLLAHAAV